MRHAPYWTPVTGYRSLVTSLPSIEVQHALAQVLDLILEEEPQALLQAFFDLADTLAADAVFVADLLQRQRFLGQQPFGEDHRFLVLQRVAEGADLLADLLTELGIGDLLFRRLSVSRLVTIAQIEGRVRGAGSELVLACDLRFAARESAVFAQPEVGLGALPGAGGIQYLTRLLGRARALEVILSADDYDADLAERYGWINRALPRSTLGGFVRSLAHRIAAFPAASVGAVKERVNAIALAPVDEFRRDSGLFGDLMRDAEAQDRIKAAMKQGLQTRDAELALGRLLGELASH